MKYLLFLLLLLPLSGKAQAFHDTANLYSPNSIWRGKDHLQIGNLASPTGYWTKVENGHIEFYVDARTGDRHKYKLMAIYWYPEYDPRDTLARVGQYQIIDSSLFHSQK